MFKLWMRLLEEAGDDGDAGGNGNGDGIMGSQGQGDQGGDGDGDQGDTGWFYADGVAGEGDAPDWFKADKYKTVQAQAEAVPALEAKLGPAGELIGAPEGDYALPDPPEGLTGEWDAEDPMLKAFIPIAKEMNLSQAAFDKIALMGAQVIADANAADDAALADAIGNIGANANQRIADVDQFLIAKVGEDAWKAVQASVGTNVEAWLAIEQVVKMASTDAQLADGDGDSTAGFTKEDIEKERYKKFPDDHKHAGQFMYDHDKEHRARVDGMWKKLYPGKDTKIIG